jgi:predicted amidophosphoribosyltransferase
MGLLRNNRHKLCPLCQGKLHRSKNAWHCPLCRVTIVGDTCRFDHPSPTRHGTRKVNKG